jgi:hypothetical protein
VRLLSFVVCSLLLAGCASFDTHVEPRADLSGIQRFWVERNIADNRKVGIKITRALQAQGREAELGPLTMMPREAQAILSFRDHWTWDFGDKLTGLDVTVRDPRTKRLLASSRFDGPMAWHLNELEIIERVVREILNPPSPPPAAQPEPAAAPAPAVTEPGSR